MALFFVGYLIAVTSTIAFIVAILTPRWIYPNNSNLSPSTIETSYRGIFYVDFGFPNGTCRDWILLYKDSVATCREPYAIACASLSIIASSLSIILLWFAGSYLYIRRLRPPSRLLAAAIAFLTFLIFWISVIVWIVMITKNLNGTRIYRENIGFSTWIAVGASGGYLIAFILFTLYLLNLKPQKYSTSEMNSRRF